MDFDTNVADLIFYKFFSPWRIRKHNGRITSCMHCSTRKEGELQPNESIRCRSLTEPMPEIAEICRQ